MNANGDLTSFMHLSTHCYEDHSCHDESCFRDGSRLYVIFLNRSCLYHVLSDSRAEAIESPTCNCWINHPVEIWEVWLMAGSICNLRLQHGYHALITLRAIWHGSGPNKSTPEHTLSLRLWLEYRTASDFETDRFLPGYRADIAPYIRYKDITRCGITAAICRDISKCRIS